MKILNRTLSFIILAAIILVSAVSNAQLPSSASGPQSKIYVQGGIGGNIYFNDNKSAFSHGGFGFNADLGWHIFADYGIRSELFLVNSKNIRGASSNYFGLSMMFELDMLDLIMGARKPEKAHLELMLGPTAMRRFKNNIDKGGDNEICFTAGLGFQYPISDGLYITGDLRSVFIMPRFDHNNNSSNITFLTAGVQYRMNDGNFQTSIFAGDGSVPASLNSNWYAGGNLGINLLSHNNEKRDNVTGPVGFGLEIMAGKRLTNIWEARFALQGISMGTTIHTFTHLAPHIDAIINLTSIGRSNYDGPFTLSLCAGTGMVARFDVGRIYMMLDGGLMGRYRLSPTSTLACELRYSYINQQIAGHDINTQTSLSVSQIAAMVGYHYNFGL